MRVLRRIGVVCLLFSLLALGMASAKVSARSAVDQGAGGSLPAGRGAAPAQATVTPGYIVVQGRILYIDRFSDRNHPAAGLKVEVWDKDEGFGKTGEKLDTVQTDGNGFFRSKEISNVDPDGPTNQREGTQDVFLKLFTDNGKVRVLKNNTTFEYVWNSYEIDPRDGLSKNVPDGLVGLPPLYIQEQTKDVEALWTFVNLAEGWMYLKDQGGRDPGNVLAYWAKNSQDGPRYDPASKAIYLRDSDAGFASVVVQQEAYSFLDSSYGTLPAEWKDHTAGPTEDLRTPTDAAAAFVEGFATFFPLAVYGDPKFESLALRSLNLDEPTKGTPGWSDGETVPGRIAGAFWDLQQADLTMDGTDKYNATFADIWEVIRDKQPKTFHQWWDGWRAMGKNTCDAIGSLFQNTIDYNSAPQVSPIPDVMLDEDTSRMVDLAQWVSDPDCADDKLSFTLVNPGEPKAGVSQVGTSSLITITPEANWFGTTIVSMRVSDGPAIVPFSFHVIVKSVNDCPLIKPRIDNPEPAQHGEPIVMNLLPHGEDIEDQPSQLVWFARVEAQDQAYITVEGQGTSILTFKLNNTVIQEKRALVALVVRDRDGCEATQDIQLIWTSRPNQKPWIWTDRFQGEYKAPKNQKIIVDLTDVAGDDEDGPDLLQWFVKVDTVDHCQFAPVGDKRHVLEFTPFDNYVGSDLIDLYVQDTGGLIASASITLTWQDPVTFTNSAPQILRNKLLGKTVGKNSAACYPLLDKAYDPDDRPESLAWFITGNDPKELLAEAINTHELCLTPARSDFEGCIPAMFKVVDPKGASDQAEIRTCWRTIKIMFPYIPQYHRLPSARVPLR